MAEQFSLGREMFTEWAVTPQWFAVAPKNIDKQVNHESVIGKK